MLEQIQPGMLPFGTKRTKALNVHETTISQNVVQPSNIRERLDEIGGLHSIKEAIRSQVLLPLRHSKIFFGSVKALHPPKGILLYGPPGTGKTMLARAIAAEAECPFLSLSLSNLENKFFGESSKLLHATFSLARKIQPCVLFFDEIDGMIRTRSEHDQSCVYGFKTEFLTHMDGINTKDTDAFIVIGCTNCVDKLDPAIKRRLPRQFRINLPTRDEMVDIFALNLKNANISHTEICDIVDSVKPGMSGSDIASVVQSAWTLQLMQYTKNRSFLNRLEQPDTTAEDVYETIGRVNAEHIKAALVAIDQINVSTEQIANDEEAPPPA